jgi:hypothetical protein
VSSRLASVEPRNALSPRLRPRKIKSIVPNCTVLMRADMGALGGNARRGARESSLCILTSRVRKVPTSSVLWRTIGGSSGSNACRTTGRPSVTTCRRRRRASGPKGAVTGDCEGQNE